MRLPLNKRFKREIREDFSRYLVIFLLLFISIGFISGFIVAGDSMITTYNESFERYNVEDGHFEVKSRLNASKRKAVEELGIRVFDLFYKDIEIKDHGVIRVFAQREAIDRLCLMQGAFPERNDEIAIDRMYADNNKLTVGDTIEYAGGSYTISGLVAFSDYSTMFQDNNDMMFDASLFGTAVVTPDSFAQLENIRYCYAWKYTRYDETKSEKETADQLMKDLNHIVELEDFLPRYLNQAIMFTGDDMGSDRAMMEVFLYIITVIIGYVYAITTKDTIFREATVIGTLKASGYTRGELIRHYMTLPVLITLVAALFGNIAGYTVFKDLGASMYYGSYSLPTFKTLWNAEAFLRTTLVPIFLMAVITWAVLYRGLSLPPLKLMRRDLDRKKKKGTVKLSHKLPFISRFRTRIIFQNMPNYLTLTVGILFANILLMFGLLLPAIMNQHMDTIAEGTLANYQYILSAPESLADEEHKTEALLGYLRYQRETETENPTAEAFSAYTLKTEGSKNYRSDEILLYGISENSRFIHADLNGKVLASTLMQDKYNMKPGDTLRLKEIYEDKWYEFTVDDFYPYDGALCLFMDRAVLNKTFDLPEEFNAAYFADTPITDIKEEYMGAVIDYTSLTRVSRQLLISMGDLMYLLDAFSVLLAVILIYLLSKIIIEKNANSISMVKILGYSDREISSLYIRSTSVIVVLAVALSLPLAVKIIDILWCILIPMYMSGWMKFTAPLSVYLKAFAIDMTAYILVVFLEMRKIRKIPMSDALKNVE